MINCRTALILTILAVALGGRQATAQTTTEYGPSAYQAYNDAAAGANISPFAAAFGSLMELDAAGGPAEPDVSLPDFRGLHSSVAANSTYFFLEDMEDGQFDVPGATLTSNGHIRTESGRNGSVGAGVTGPNSIDEDNGGVNMEGRQPVAASFRQNPGQVGFIDFSANQLGGNFPTHVGIVALALETTFPTVTVHFLDPDDVPIATITAEEPFTSCDYGDDSACFMGVQHDEGISALTFTGDWDWDHVQYGFAGEDPPPVTSYEWTANGLGDWQDPNDWTPSGGPPMDSTQTAVLGGMTSGPTIVAVNRPVTVNRIEFDSANPYAVAGLASVNLATDPDDPTDPADPFGPPSLSVSGGAAHQFQAVVNLQDDTTVDIEMGSTLSFNNALNLNGHDLDKTGGGTLLINNALISGGGTVTGLDGVIGGIGTVAGDLINMGGIVSPGYDPGNLTASGGRAGSSVPESSTFLLLTLGTLAALGWPRSRKARVIHGFATTPVLPGNIKTEPEIIDTDRLGK